jgi:hypothetical protein
MTDTGEHYGEMTMGPAGVIFIIVVVALFAIYLVFLWLNGGKRD